MFKSKVILLIILKSSVILLLLCIFFLQVQDRKNIRRPSLTFFNDVSSDFISLRDFFPKNTTLTEKIDLSQVLSAEKILNLPTWSQSYQNCNETTEISCVELIHAANLIDNYTKTSSFLHNFILNLTHFKSLKFDNVISAIYSSFLMSIATNRKFLVLTDSNDIFNIFPFLKEHSIKNLPQNIIHWANNYSVACGNISHLHDILIDPIMWPQMPYIHPIVAPFLRKHFGYNAGYYVGNFLFSPLLSNLSNCSVSNSYGIVRDMTSREFLQGVLDCDLNNKSTINQIVINSAVEITNKANLCFLKKAISANNYFFSLGSQLGWFGMAMSGHKANAITLYERSCMKMSNSQCGSLYHVYNPKKKYHFSSNNDFYICGENWNDARLYKKFLLW